jgi:hypothetical protein
LLASDAVKSAIQPGDAQASLASSAGVNPAGEIAPIGKIAPISVEG